MIRRILLALDNSAPGIQAQAYAIELARSYKAAVTGLGILDTPWITAAQPEPLGGGAFKIQRDDAVIEQSHYHISFIMSEFKAACQKAGIKHQAYEAQGFPAVEIEKLAHEHDIIVIGKTTDFHFDLDEDTDLTVKHLARDNARSILMVPPTIPEGNKVLVTFDGGLQSSRSMHMFIMLGFAEGKDIHILSVDKDPNVALVNATRAHNLFSAHGIDTKVEGIAQTGSAAQQIIDRAHELKVSMLVMGGFSHTALRETFFGSATKSIMKSCDFPLFLHH
ncbi:MAG: universal stress protein [Alphaproteobacteria bacterium]|nr:universal stress protein [Alphaproteobacteria bacterium]NCQ66947.1 universal stress protein [Alphaproteobacteria bacterium]